MKTSVLLAFVCAMGLSLLSVPAHAQATRTWVSGVGDDANPCSRTAPCKTFAGAISKTAAAGEINVLDPGGFGAVTITKAITISSASPEAGVLVSGTNGIVVAANTGDVVVLEGLDIEGLGSGIDGVRVNSGSQVYVIRCKIHHFVNNGINMQSSTSGARLFVQDSFVFQNGAANSNPLTGGVLVNGTSNVGSIVNTTIDSNQNFAIRVGSAGNVIGIAKSVLSNSPSTTSNAGGTIVSFGPSSVVSPPGTFNTTTAFQ